MVNRRDILGLMASLGALSALAGCSVTKTSTGEQTPTSAPPTSAAPKPTPSATPTPTTTPTPTPTTLGTPLPEGAVNILVLGSDSRSENIHVDARADVICLVQLSPDRSHINMVSVPRDTLAYMPDGSQGKINGAYPQAGAEGMANAVSTLLGGVPVHYTLETGFNQFMRIASKLDGFDVNNRIASRVNVDYPTGWIHLNGGPALDYVRQRTPLPNGDLDRTERARAALTGMMLRIRQFVIDNKDSFIANRLPGLWAEVFPGRGVTMEHALSLVDVVTNLKVENVSSVMVPISGFGMVGGASVNFVNQAMLNEVIAGLQAHDLTGYVAKYGMDTTPR